jgi:3-oxoacyl-[acyl-carrier-protein] synthase II
MGGSTQPKVVVTGIGLVTALGNDIDAFFANLLAGKSGIKRVTRFDATEYPSQIGGEITDFDPNTVFDPKEARRNDRYTLFAVDATRRAMADAGLTKENLPRERTGIIIGSGIGGMETIESQSQVLFEKGHRRVSPFMIPSLIANMASGVVAIDTGALGPNFSVVSACATGSHALGESMHKIRNGEADIMIAGGSEAAITRLGYAGFCSMKAMSTHFNETPERASRPFDRDRDGFVMGEGAGVLILEREEHARARGARIYCELGGYGASNDAYHITSPDPEGYGLKLCLEACLKSAGMTTSDVTYINAHGTSTKYNDQFETNAVRKVFGKAAYDLRITSTKSMTGHLLGAAGAIEAAVCCKVIAEGQIPPTINLDNPDPECDLNYLPHKGETKKVDVAVSNNLGFGGHNVSLLFRRI